MDVLKKILRRNGGINSEAPQKFFCFNILHRATRAITHELIFVKMRITKIMHVSIFHISFWLSHFFVY